MNPISLSSSSKINLQKSLPFNLIFIFSIGTYKGIQFYKQKQYEKTYEYKLINIGYSKENTKLLENKQKELHEPKETIIDYEDDEYYDYDEDLDNKKEDDLVL